MALKKRQQEILQALDELGGMATTRQIAAKTGLNVNGVSQSLGALDQVEMTDNGKGGDTEWRDRKKCHRCNEIKFLGDFIPDTECCWECHELILMEKTGHGVVKLGPLPGSLELDGQVFKVKL